MKTLRVRPVLVETTEKSRICHLTQKAKHLNWPIALHEIECSIILDSINYDIVLISLDNRDFKKGDTVYSEVLDELFELSYRDLAELTTNINMEGIYKVIANQRQFSDELTEKLVEEYNNGGMNDFIIEIERMYLRAGKNKDLDSYEPTLSEQGYITPVQNKEIQKPLNDYINQRHNQDRCIGFIGDYETKQSETVNIIRNIPYPIIYTEEDVRILFKNWIKLKSNDVGLDNLSFDEWFETVKK